MPLTYNIKRKESDVDVQVI